MFSITLNGMKSFFERWENGILWLVTVFLVVLVLCQSLLILSMEFSNSDATAPILLAAEAIRGGSLLPDWVWQGTSVYTVPTCMFFWIGLLYILIGNAYVSYMLVCGITVLLLMLALMYAMSPLGIKPYFALSASALLLPMVSMFYYPGFMLVSIVAVGYCACRQTGYNGFTQKVLRFLLPFVAFSTGVESSRLMLTCWLPLVCYHFLPILMRSTPFSNSFRELFPLKVKAYFEPVIWAVCNILGIFYGRTEVPPSYVTNISYHFFSDFPRKFWESVDGLLSSLHIYAGGQPLLSVAGLQAVVQIFLFICVIYLAVYAAKIGKTKAGISLFVFLFASCASFAMTTVTTISVNQVSAFRFLFPVLGLYAVCFCITIDFVQKKKSGQWMLFIMVAIVSLLQTLRLPLAAAYQMIKQPQFLRDTQILVEYMAGHGLSKGYASYWNAYNNTMASNEQLEIAAFLPTGAGSAPNFIPFAWIAPKRYYSRRFADSNIFVMLTNAEDAAAKNNPTAQHFLDQGRKLEPVLDYQVYVFDRMSQFVILEAELAQIGDSFTLLPGDNFSTHGEAKTEGSSLVFSPGKGQILYGPYCPLPQGIYSVVVRYQGATTSSGERLPAFFDLIDRLGERVFSRVELDPNLTEYVIEGVKIPNDVTNAEFRIFIPDDSLFRIDSFEVIKTK